jgi:hypothetical protein
MSKNTKDIDRLTGFKVLDDFRRFEQRDEIYCRSEWDEIVATDKAANFFSGYFLTFL